MILASTINFIYGRSIQKEQELLDKNMKKKRTKTFRQKSHLQCIQQNVFAVTRKICMCVISKYSSRKWCTKFIFLYAFCFVLFCLKMSGKMYFTEIFYLYSLINGMKGKKKMEKPKTVRLNKWRSILSDRKERVSNLYSERSGGEHMANKIVWLVFFLLSLPTPPPRPHLIIAHSKLITRHV